MSEELAARLMARIAVPPMPFAPDTYTAGRMDQFTEMITQLRALPEVDKEQVLADAKARIEGERIESDGMDSWENGYHTGIDAALAALTQPQAEQWHENDEADKAATAAGVADADLVTAARRLARYSDRADDGIAYLTDTGIKDNAGALAETLEQLKDALPPGPYAKAFRERVCPVPEFPGIQNQQEGQA